MSTYAVKLRPSDNLRLKPHPDACSESGFAAWCDQQRQKGRRLAVDLFSGAGGLSLGLEAAGWTVAASVDSDPRALETHRSGFPGLALGLDLSVTADRERLTRLLDGADIDLIAGGPPCQPFSRAGRSKIRSLVAGGSREPEDHRRELWRAFLDVVLTVQPRAMLMENVPDMALGDEFKAVRTMIGALEGAGYRTQLSFVDAWRFAVPQLRKRLILLARRDDGEFAWPEPASTMTTLADAIGDLPALDVATDDIGARRLAYRPETVSDFAGSMRDAMTEPVIWDHMTRPVREDDRQIFDLMTPDMLYTHVPVQLRRYSVHTFDDKYKRLDWAAPCRSITAHIAKDGYWYIHPQQPRTLSVREAARIQTFPDHFRFAGTRSDAFRQIGNAVPPLLGKAAAEALAAGTPRHTQTTPERVRGALTAWALAERAGTAWHVLPGEKMTIPVAAAMAIGLRHAASPHDLSTLATPLAGRKKLQITDLERLSRPGLRRNTAGVVHRLRSLGGSMPNWRDPADVMVSLRMGPAEARIFRLLLGEDLLLDGQGVLRVAARVAGTRSDRVNRLTEGRVDLAMLSGSGEHAPLRTAALRLLGTTLCRERIRHCGRCPLRAGCRSSIGDRDHDPELDFGQHPPRS
ncbi:hypothetical protein Afil01_02080 [Actinorhabdospora filicis]|uniref:Cytosine-specific methyltransferase n=1 Tax=Actinorhabdospora filicis TaxID=1785913 RepID=A0A9W6SIR1_9ACTN|nr:DNA cytosine methyltransferase [Actinorhabdospora filicis]GLZ75401.1 hypothetical protein Afil01_02080 [Actinorhabdospora filicis]